MNMVRIKQFLLAAVMGLSALGFTACSDSDVAAPGVLTVDQTYVTQGVETGVESAVIEVPVTCNGEWIAVVDSCNWLAVMDEGQMINEGNGVIKLKVDENRTGVGRKNVLSILMLDSDKEIDIPVYQNNMYRGEVPTNGDAATWFNNNKVGCGVNYSYLMEPKANRSGQFNPIEFSNGCNIFNMTILEDKQNKDAGYYTMARHEVAQLNDKALVNSISKSQYLNVELEMGCSFGFIEFQAKGEYTSFLTDNSDHVNYSVCRDCPVLDVALQVPNIRTKAAEDALDMILFPDSKTGATAAKIWQQINSEKNLDRKQKLFDYLRGKQKPTLGGFFGEGFRNDYWKLYYFDYFKDSLYKDNKVKIETEFNALMKQLDEDFGPFFISGGQFGGSLNLYAVVDRKNLNDSTHFGADITANISSIFELSGRAKFDSKGQQLYKNSDITMQVYGGNAAETANSVVDLLGGKDLSRTDSLAAILNKWAASFAKFDADSVIPERAAPILYTVTPIWSLFEDAALSAKIRQWFIEEYKNRGIGSWIKIIDSSKQPDTLQLLQVLAGKKDEYSDDSSGDSSGDSSSDPSKDPSDKSDEKDSDKK